MAHRVLLRHITSYRYDRKIQLGHQTIRLRPAPHSRTRTLSYSLTIEPENHFLNWLQDPYGNYLGRAVFPEKTDHFRTTVELMAHLEVYNPFDFFLDEKAENFPFELEDGLQRDLAPYLEAGPTGKVFSQYLGDIGSPEGATISVLVDINRRVYKDISYNIRMEQNIQQPDDTLRLGSGSCRDSALLLVEILRGLGIAARFVSGYLIQLVPDLKPRTGPPGPSSDFTDLHAWVEAYVPGAGWVGLDPTSGLLAGEGHIPLAAAPRPGSAAPIEGSLERCEVEFDHHMEVQRIDEPPRSTRPFDPAREPELADALDTAGREVDRRLQTMGFTLTSGGEPTFVSDEDRNSDEWGPDALGPTKKHLAMDLMRRLSRRWAAGALIHSGQGKWYPGESLPRWALSCYWRPDGVPVWKNPELLCDEDDDRGYTLEDARLLMETLVEKLGIERRFIHEAYEDPLHAMLSERNLPQNVSLEDSKLDDPRERARLARILSQGIESPTGFVLPIQKGSWKSGPWPTRAGRLVLIPGDSPLGLRLPLPSLPWVNGSDAYQPTQDPTSFESPTDGTGYAAYRPATGSTSTLVNSGNGAATVQPPGRFQARVSGSEEGASPQVIHQQQAPDGPPPLVEGESAAWLVRTAMTIQPRDGRLYVFMPPVQAAADWFALISEIEAVCQELGYAIVLEGYLPPHDPKYRNFQITPDPGVIEVNLPPAENWDSWSTIIRDLYAEARECGLSTEKYLLGGRIVGTGGGCHWVFGGRTASESPFLRRPDLLESWIRYTNNHPSLSYAFSGLFIGASSQAPRPDEASLEAVHDLELAFASMAAQLDGATGDPPLWLADRLFRNFLTDASGNTHRTEMCIDKLYSPDHSAGRRGLVEFRSFEMVPHRDQALAQNLVLRALTMRFLEQPYREPMIQWGSTLRDRWMLPEFLQSDIQTILDDLDSSGISIPREYFSSFHEFRFPEIGTLTWDDGEVQMEIELRHALEPWPVTGEEPGGGGTVRYVDSSVERIQVKAKNFDRSRYVLLSRGQALPLEECGPGTFVGGVRYKAWRFYAGLHPAVSENPTLTIDLYDRNSGRIVAGCRYHASHPAGRSYDEEPVNAFEAEARREARFSSTGHTPSQVFIAPIPNPDSRYPLTLDLRFPV